MTVLGVNNQKQPHTSQEFSPPPPRPTPDGEGKGTPREPREQLSRQPG